MVKKRSYLPVADPSMVWTCTITSVYDGLLKTSKGSTDPSPSSTV